ncbi:MAG TPA: ABC transporter ATP-binding protein [Acidimicrobiales bacterium]|nr:ABC transporter ATP-binding protein [Acidimicrobiales bacterium]
MLTNPERGSDEPLLAVEGLRTRFPTERGVVHAVDDVSFDLARGERLGVVGESGSGKSVLARSVMRLLPSAAWSAGSVTFGGRDLMQLSDDQAREIWGSEIAMVFQNPMTSLNPVMRIGRQITESLELHEGLQGAAASDRAVALLRMVGIPEPASRLRSYPHELSGGMRQRVGIAIAIACSPKLLIADEPTTALDVTIQRKILDLLDRLGRELDMALILITHDLGVVAGRTDRLLVMYGGRVVEQGPTAALFRRPRHPYTASLLAAVPRLHQPSHTRLAAIPGRPVDVVDPAPGCRFAPRCARAQARCTEEDPQLAPAPGSPGHAFACFNPVEDPTSGSTVPVERPRVRGGSVDAEASVVVS